MVKAHLILLISLSLSLEEVEMGLIVTYIHLNQRTSKIPIILVQKHGIVLPVDLRNMSDPMQRYLVKFLNLVY